jgi:Arc/MetJ-type ribon-helix-helix transcriptional regulator
VKVISLRLPDKLIEEIDELVSSGMYASRTEALREAARNLLKSQIGSLKGSPKQVSKDEIWEEFIKELEE